ncbi:DUF1878 domain-containing protein [Cytobacillus oceanisediminis]|uniref:DUF1878 domain-containing protein n=1 Tax=Cytobacillus oceanisediminis TaxID=665099 RepID=UPI001C21B794|nr:DUF1878 domain-containing protein [Cytobacillus oceanisediminis]MBU8772019.1 DUF1878 domain-containing protein [Cytobacillus oceanisediminis]
MTLEERLDFIEYRQELLFENSDYARLLFEYKVTREQTRAIADVFEDYRNKIEAGEKVFHGSYEQRIYEVVPQCDHDYHFAEFLAQENHKQGSWEEVFVALYGDMPKFKFYVENRG